jgi:hypothetical protein
VRSRPVLSISHRLPLCSESGHWLGLASLAPASACYQRLSIITCGTRLSASSRTIQQTFLVRRPNYLRMKVWNPTGIIHSVILQINIRCPPPSCSSSTVPSHSSTISCLLKNSLNRIPLPILLSSRMLSSTGPSSWRPKTTCLQTSCSPSGPFVALRTTLLLVRHSFLSFIRLIVDRIHQQQ